MLNLTEREKIVLYGLVRYPELNDIELAQKINIKRPTITAIRNRLEKQEIYTTKKIPDLTRLGCELITITHTQYNPITPYNTRKKTKKQNPNTFLEIQTDTQQLTISAEKNYTQTKKQTEEHIVFGCSNDYFSADDVKSISFPLSSSKVFMFFDYSPLLGRYFGLPRQRIVCDTKIRVTKPYEFNGNEKRVYSALVEYPNFNESRIASRLSISRRSVHEIIRKFNEEFLIKTVRIPNLRKLEFELIVFNHVSLNPQFGIEDRKKNIELVMNVGHNIIMISGGMDSASISYFKDYIDSQKVFTLLTDYGQKGDYLEGEPERIIFPMEDIKYYAEGEFGRLVKAMSAP